MINQQHVGSDFDDFLRDECLFDEASARRPIIATRELVVKWADFCSFKYSNSDYNYEQAIAEAAVEWAANQELEACCEWLKGSDRWCGSLTGLRAARRPKPLNLKEQALNDLDTIQTHDSFGFQIIDLSNIRRALEALPND